jgi:hypothetical protein
MAIKGTVQALCKLTLAKARDNGHVQAQVDLGAEALAIPATADALYDDKANLGAAASSEIDLAGALVDPAGDVVTFAKVYAIGVFAEKANAHALQVGGAAANAFFGPFKDVTDALSIPAGGCALVANPAGWPVTAGTGDLLKLANAGGVSAIGYRLVVLGASEV